MSSLGNLAASQLRLRLVALVVIEGLLSPPAPSRGPTARRPSNLRSRSFTCSGSVVGREPHGHAWRAPAAGVRVHMSRMVTICMACNWACIRRVGMGMHGVQLGVHEARSGIGLGMHGVG